MVLFLRFFFWPIVWIVVTVGGWVLKPDLWSALWRWYSSAPWPHTVEIVGVYFGWRIFCETVRFINEYFDARHLVSMKVLLPRSDSKIDQEGPGRPATTGTPAEPCRTTMASTPMASMVSTVSRSDSPFLVDEVATLKVMVSADSRFAAVSNERRVRVESS